jgi:hypothetical protein
MVVHTYNPSSQKVETEGSGLQGLLSYISQKPKAWEVECFPSIWKSAFDYQLCIIIIIIIIIIARQTNQCTLRQIILADENKRETKPG